MAFLFSQTCLIAQESEFDKYFSLNFSEIDSKNSEFQEYNVILKWQNFDPITANKINCNAVEANFSIELDSNYASWSNVNFSQIDDFNQNDFVGTNLPSFNNFSYCPGDTNFLKEDFYKNIAVEQRDIAKWLVSDAIQMQGVTLYFSDSLKFNEEFYPEFLENYDVKFENWINFSSRYQKLIWTGITELNNELCAIVKFESLYNPVEVNNNEMKIKGRSLYYGELWISLEDKQLEYAIMLEDVVMKLRSSSFPEEQLIDLQREIVFEKIK